MVCHRAGTSALLLAHLSPLSFFFILFFLIQVLLLNVKPLTEISLVESQRHPPHPTLQKYDPTTEGTLWPAFHTKLLGPLAHPVVTAASCPSVWRAIICCILSRGYRSKSCVFIIIASSRPKLISPLQTLPGPSRWPRLIFSSLSLLK